MNIKNIINGYLGNTQVNRIYRGSELVWPKFGNKYLIGGNFTTYSPNINLLENRKNTFAFLNTYNGTTGTTPPFNGSTNNIVATIDNSTQIDPEFAVTKINRLNSNVTQMDYLGFQTYTMGPNKEMEFSFWYYGTFGTIVRLYSHDTDVYVERWDASTNAYITNNSRICNVPVTTNTWQYIQVRFRNTNATTYKRGMAYMVFHYNQENVALSNTEYWKITCVKYWYVESITKNKIIRLNDDDSVDNTWYNNSSYTSGDIYELIYNNNKIYAAGSTTLDGGLVRLHMNGTKDISFNIGTGFDDDLYALNLDRINQKIYVGGGFTIYNGGTQNRLVRLNMDGTKDTSFNIGTGFDGRVRNIILDNINSKIYVGGDFLTFQDNTQNRLVRLNMDGTKDTSFGLGTGFNSHVRSIIIDNSKIYVGGHFTTFNGVTQRRLIRLNLDGTKDTSFDIGTGFGDGGVRSIIIDNINSKIYVGGNFTTYNGNTQNRLIRLNMNGSKDTSFNIGTGLDGFIPVPASILIDNEKNKIYILGSFTKYNDQQQKNIVRLNMDGSIDNTFNIQLDSYAQTILQTGYIPIVSLTINGVAPIEVGNTKQFTVTYNPHDTTEVGVVWTSSNQNVATVDSSGLVTGVSTGNVTITATSIVNETISDTYSLEITSEFAYGVKQDLSGDGKTLIRVGNLELHKTLPIQSKMRGCLLNDNGTVNYYLSNDSDLLKEDGVTPSILDGTDGNVMTEIPAFYILEKDKDGFAYTYISEIQLPGFNYIPKQYIGRYEAVINRDTGKLMSIINTSTTYRGGNNTTAWDGTYRSLLGRPCTYQNRSTYRTGARMDRSSKWNISTTLSDYTVQLLFTIEYATYNSQAAFNSSLTVEGYKQGGLGAGVTNINNTTWINYNNRNPFIPCGYTADLGNRTGVKNYNNDTLTTQVNRYRGIEIPFGHIWKHRDGFVIEMSNNYTIAKYYIFDNPDNYADTKTANARYLCDMPSENGYIKWFNKYTNIPSTIGGSAESWSYDYAYIENDGAGTLRGIFSGGSAYIGSNAGLGYSDASYPPTTAGVAAGARLCYNEENIIIQFEDIPIISLTINGVAPIEVGNTEQFTVTYNPLNTTEVGVVWTSSNQNVATVDSNGLITAIGVGNVIITATSIVNSSISDTYSLEIIPEVIELVSLTITGDTEVNRGNTLQLGISYNPLNTTEVGVVWTSSNQNVATIDSNGLVTGVSVGNVIITATSIINGVISDTHNITVNYVSDIDLFAYGVKQDLSGDGKSLIRVGNLELHKTLPIQSKMRGCLLNDNGTVNYYLSNDSDYYKEDGVTPSILDGTDGNVMVEIPAFYVLEEDIDGFAYRYISETQLPGFKYIPKQYIGRYEAAINRSTGKLMSIINNSPTYRGGDNNSSWDGTYRSLLGRPCTNRDRAGFRRGARKDRSSKWNISTTLSDYTIQLLFIIEYATYNSQATFNDSLTVEGYKQGGLGVGVTTIDSPKWAQFNLNNPFVPCGHTADLGNRTGIKNYVAPDVYFSYHKVNRYRGIELPFGHIPKHRDGCIIYVDSYGNRVRYYIFDNPDDYANVITMGVARYLCDMPTGASYIKRFNKYTNIASTGGGSSESWGYDRYFTAGDGDFGFFSGGHTESGSQAGLGCSNVYVSLTSLAGGARLTYCNENIIITTN